MRGWDVASTEQGFRMRGICGYAAILNTYRTLMTRGLKGCYVYAVDPGVRNPAKSSTRSGASRPLIPVIPSSRSEATLV